MNPTLTAAIIAGAIAAFSAVATNWMARRNTERTIENSAAIERLKLAAEEASKTQARQQAISSYSEPLLHAAHDLQSRIWNILEDDFLQTFLVGGDARERDYAVENTTFLIAQFFCWSELVRRDIQFIPLAENEATLKLAERQDELCHLWGSDKLPPCLRIFAGEQRAIGEALIVEGSEGPQCMGYGRFLKALKPGVEPLLDAVRHDVLRAANDLGPARKRLCRSQHALIGLIDQLDPDHLRFPAFNRTLVKCEEAVPQAPGTRPK